MKTVLTAILVFVSVAASAEPTLDGRWQSDRDLTMRFARERAKLEERTTVFLGQMMGRLTLEFSQGVLKSSMPSWESVRANGDRSQLAGFTESHPYAVVAATSNQVAIVSPEPVSGAQRITVYNFDDPNTMWVYLGAAASSDLNIREYFVRVK